MKYLLFIVTVAFSFIANAGFTTMTLEGVKEANGVWTASGVMDSMGFVRTTGAVTVAGNTASTAVALAVERNIARNTFRNVVSKMGPYGIAAVGAYEVYDWFSSGDGTHSDLVPCDSSKLTWCYPAPAYDNSYTYGKYYLITGGTTEFRGSTPSEVCDSRATAGGVARVSSIDTASMRCILVSISTGAYSGYYQYYFVNCTAGMTVSSCVNHTDPSKTPTPIGSDYFNSLLDPSLPVMADGFNKIPSLRDGGIPISSTGFKPYSSWLGEPYFKDGQWWRDRIDISPAPISGQPTRVRTDIGPVKIDGATDPNVVPDTNTGGGSAQPKEKPTFCEANPMSIACAEMGTLKDEKLETTELPVNVSYTPWGSSNAQCPSPRVIPLWEGKSISMSYAPVCDFVSMLRPLLIALAFVTAAFILGGFGRSGGGE